jgi:hypothetical protein
VTKPLRKTLITLFDVTARGCGGDYDGGRGTQKVSVAKLT